MDYLSKIRSFVNKHNMIEAGDVIAVGVSGGADSVCLLLMLYSLKEELSFDLFAVNVEHGIRGAESIADSEFTKDLCERVNVPFFRYDIDVPALSKEMGLSLEETARKARYEIFDRACIEHGACKIAVAHNMDDEAETIVHNIARGTSLSGLSGIRPVRDNIIRPLLCLCRAEIEDYLAMNDTSFRTDSTNLNDDYTRNKIRHHIIPELVSINPAALEHIKNMSDDVNDVLDYLDNVVSVKTKEIVKEKEDGYHIELTLLRKEPDIIKREIIKDIVSKAVGNAKDISRIHLQDCLALSEKGSGSRIDLLKGVQAEIEYDTLIIRRRSEEVKTGTLDISVPLEVPGISNAENIRVCTSLQDRSSVKIEKKTYTKQVDCDKIKGRLSLRHRRTGDMLVINEAGGRISIKDYFINEKIPRSLRDEIWLICDEEQVIWVIGYRLSEAFKVREDTKKVLRLEVTEA